MSYVVYDLLPVIMEALEAIERCTFMPQKLQWKPFIYQEAICDS